MDCHKKKLLLTTSLLSILVLILFTSFSYYYLYIPEDPASPLIAQPLPLEAAAAPEPEIITYDQVIPSNSTLQDALLACDFTPVEIHQLLEETKKVYNLNRVMAGHQLSIERFADGRFKNLHYQISDEEYLLVDYASERYAASRHQREFNVIVEEIYGRIDSSLWDTLMSGGEAAQLVVELANILRWDVDFTAMHPGDAFKLIVEKKYLDGEFIKYGEVVAIQFSGSDKEVFGFLFKDPETDEVKYYDEKGRSLKKTFLRVPFDFNPRVTSGFTYSRFHPILKKRRPHLGLDYGAPTGTPVLASANGKVIFAGRDGGFGKVVRIRHSNGYVSGYAHLSQILVKTGQRVMQGGRIGKVGSTGLATGPHLDYRIQDSSGKHIDPRKLVSLPSEHSIDQRYAQDFDAVRDSLTRRLQSIPETRPYINRVAMGVSANP
ncbi:MAG: peptidoglycan DD-metalloendopeptidase family protein [Acidobacteriota bacterium]